MSEILKRLRESMEEKMKKEELTEEPKEIAPKPKKPRKEAPKVEVEEETAPYIKRNALYNQSQLLNFLKTVNVRKLSKKQQRALEALGTGEPRDKSDRKMVSLWDQKKTTIASLELILSMFMQMPIEIRPKESEFV